ncbi:hypothetical protein [Exiguobacterium acetylicum]|uniref:Phage protein n=1 Tax=Exiguobacterium acetylicum TaxID=41170 RepID=A0ABX8GFR2_EXIAC|nr:hypothetical protein [Exiguobacterium acetylicum]QWB31972.1 hypothetical protein KKI46_17585 [Exiguobacterium acetylicum]
MMLFISIAIVIIVGLISWILFMLVSIAQIKKADRKKDEEWQKVKQKTAIKLRYILDNSPGRMNPRNEAFFKFLDKSQQGEETNDDEKKGTKR